MANGTITDNGFALEDLGHDGDVIVSEQHANAFADRSGVAADGDKMSIATRAD
jgi:hypothetical protein